MRVEGSRPNSETASAQRLEPVRPARTARTDHSVEPPQDHLNLSPSAQFVLTATKAVEEIPAIREEIVERVRQKLASGEVGQDTHRLAERMIEHLLADE